MATTLSLLTGSVAVLLLSLVFFSHVLPTSSKTLPTRLTPQWRSLGPTSPSSPLTFFVGLPNHNVDRLESRLTELSNPTHPSYGQWMTAEEVNALIAPPPSAVESVRQWLLTSGIPTSHLTTFSHAVEVRTTVAHVNALFNTSIHSIQHTTKGSRGMIAHGAITIPDSIHSQLALLTGIQSIPFPIKHHSVKVIPTVGRSPSSSNPQSSTPGSRFHLTQSYGYQAVIWSPQSLASWYGYPDLTHFNRPIGYVANTSIAVAQFDEVDQWNNTIYESISMVDVASQGQWMNVPSIQSPPTVYGHNEPDSPGLEPSLDIQTITTNNAVANSTHWEEPTGTWMYGLCTRLMAQPDRPQVVSVSYGIEEDYADDDGADGISGASTYIAQTEVLLAALGAMGVTMVVSSGDEGANGNGNPYCMYSSQEKWYLYASWPATSPHVVAVGATMVDPNYNGWSSFEVNNSWCGFSSENVPSGYQLDPSYPTPLSIDCWFVGGEVAVDQSTGFRSGGGFSRVYAQPSWQSSAVHAYLKSGVALPPSTYYNASNRAIPDVSMYGAATGILFHSQVEIVAGTSVSAPLFASLVAMLNQVSLSNGGSTLGFLNPLLYYMYSNVSGSYRDIVTGDNILTEECQADSNCGGARPCSCSSCKGFTAHTGWDPVTGLGSPSYTVMAAYVQQLAIASTVKQNSSSSSSAAPHSSSRFSSSRFSSSVFSSSRVSSSAASSSVRSSSTVSSSARSSSAVSSSAHSSSAVFSSSSSAPTAIGHLCFISYSLPGTIDYPWSVAISLQFTYNPAVVATKRGSAVSLLSGSGTRTYTNHFGTSFTSILGLNPVGSLGSDNLLYLTGSPVDELGLSWTLSSEVALPGVIPTALSTTINLNNASGVIAETGSAIPSSSPAWGSRVSPTGQGWLSSVPGFTNVTIGAADSNALTPDYVACQAPITFVNGLLHPLQPTSFNGATRFTYTYFVSDGLTYSIQGNLTISTQSAFATTADQLGNRFQVVTNVTGTRLYTYLRMTSTLLSTVNFSIDPLSPALWYPYTLLESSPGIYSMDTVPFLSAVGLQLGVNPPVPVNGQLPHTTPSYSMVSIATTSYNNTATLTDTPLSIVIGVKVAVPGSHPLLTLQSQTYLF